MASDEQERLLAPGALKGPLPEADVRRWFHPRSDLTYRTLADLAISEVDAFQSLFTGSLLRNSTFDRVVFARSDLDGIRAERCTFSDCDFSVCDIRSSHFASCVFRNCKLSESYVDACEFIGCSLLGCNFSNSSVTNSVFSATVMDGSRLSRSTHLHNRYYDCTFQDMTLGDCTFLYVVFRNCALVRVALNSESVGGIFGLKKEQLLECRFIYLGEIQENLSPEDDALALFTEEYQKRRWHIGELVLALNCGSSSIIEAFSRYFAQTTTRIAEIGFAKGEELEFLADIIEELAGQERLPFLIVIATLEWCSAVEKLVAPQPSDLHQRADMVHLLVTRTVFVSNTLLERLGETDGYIDGRPDEPIMLKATFQTVPRVALVDVMNSLAAASGLPTIHPTSAIRSETGSYLEWVWTTLFSAFGLQVFLFLINGCVVQLTELRHRAKLLVRPESTQAYSRLALSPVQHASPAIIGVVEQLASFTKHLPWLTGADLSGYASPNLKALEVVERPKSTRRKRTEP
jgi:uncharacterized protein YjbI with pentapeptide repeats